MPKPTLEDGFIEPRHAEVAPSFFLTPGLPTLESSLGPIDAQELLAWTRPELPGPVLRDHLLAQLKFAQRARIFRMQAQPTGIRLVPGWQSRLTSVEAGNIEALLASRNAPFQELTLSELRDGLNLPWTPLLHLLARLEAAYWKPSKKSDEAQPTAQASELPGTTAARSMLSEALRLPWVRQIKPSDVRFRVEVNGQVRSPADWLEEQRKQPDISLEAVEYAQRLLDASRQTVIEEARDIVQAVESHLRAEGKSQPSLSGAAWEHVIILHCFSPVGAGRDLELVAQMAETSERRVARAAVTFLEYCLAHSAATPTLERVLSALADAPESMTLDQATETMAPLLGADVGVESLEAWVRTLGRKLPFSWQRRFPRQARGPLGAKRNALAETLYRIAAQECRLTGCTSLVRVMGLYALESGLPVQAPACIEALERLPEVGWVNRQTGWFRVLDDESSVVATRVSKALAVAEEPMSDVELAAAILSDERLFSSAVQGFSLVLPPLRVLRELFAAWPWVRVIEQRYFQAENSQELRESLSGHEQALVQLMEEAGGIATAPELAQAMADRVGASASSTNNLLGNAPFVAQLEPGIYRLRGRKLSGSAIDAARARLGAA